MSNLQIMAKHAPRMKVRLASDRLIIKMGRKHTPAELAEVHSVVVSHMQSDENLYRFLGILIGVPHEVQLGSCTHSERQSQSLRLAGRYALGVKHAMGLEFDAAGICCFEKLTEPEHGRAHIERSLALYGAESNAARVPLSFVLFEIHHNRVSNPHHHIYPNWLYLLHNFHIFHQY